MAAILSPSMLAYEDDFLLIIDKPAGMLVHPTVSERGTTLYDYVKAYYEANGINAGIHPVSRLDRNTSGLVILPRSLLYSTGLVSSRLKRNIWRWPAAALKPAKVLSKRPSPARKAVSLNAALTTRAANTPKQPMRFWRLTAIIRCSRSVFSPDARTRYVSTLLLSATR